MDTVLVIGGCGGLDFHITSQLRDQCADTTISVFDINTTRNNVPNVTYIKVDLSNPTDVQAAL